ncbi:hypothetical protein [Hydrogenophaga sp. T2]|uniref:hypothetical protein n=1 Tax=Hydrogenophaga sp. T2 TaxID=3132823 RepID=UPI003CF2B278
MCTPKSLSRNASYALIPLDSSCSESSDLLPSPPQHGAGRRNEHAPPPRKVCEAAQAVQRRDEAAHGAPSFRFESGTLFVRAGSDPEGDTHDGVTPERSMALSQAAPTTGLLASSSASAAYGGLAAALACKGVAFAFDASKILMCFTTIGSMYDMYATGMGVVDAHKQHVHCMKMRVDCIKILTDAQQRLAKNEDPEAQRLLISAAREVLGLLHGLSASFEKLYVHKDVAAVWATRRELQRMLVDTDTAIAELMLTSDSLEADNGLVRQALGDALQTASILRDTLEAMPKARLHGKGPWQRWRVGHSEWVRLVPLVKRLRVRQEAQEEKDSAARECDPQHKSNPTFAQVLTLLKGLQTRTDKLGGNDPLGGIGQHEAKFWRDVHLAGAQPLLLLTAHASLLAQAPGALTGVAGLLLPMAVLQGMLDLKDVKRSHHDLALDKASRLDSLERIAVELAGADLAAPHEAHLTRTVMHAALNRHLTDEKTRKIKQWLARFRGFSATAGLSASTPANLSAMFAVGVMGVTGVSIGTGGVVLGVVGAVGSTAVLPLLGGISYLKKRDWSLDKQARREHKDALRFLQALKEKGTPLHAFMNASDEDRDEMCSALGLRKARRLAHNPYVVSTYVAEGLRQGAHHHPCPGYPSPARMVRWASVLGIPLSLIDSLAPHCPPADHVKLTHQFAARALGRHWYTDAPSTPVASKASDASEVEEAWTTSTTSEATETADDISLATDSDREDQAPSEPPAVQWLGRLETAMKALGETRRDRVGRALARKGVPVRNPLGTPKRVLEALDADPLLAGALLKQLGLSPVEPQSQQVLQTTKDLVGGLTDTMHGLKQASRMQRRLGEMAQVIERLQAADPGPTMAAAA